MQPKLRQGVLEAAHISVAYLWWGCSRIAMMPPFDLTQGCIRTNVGQLMERGRSVITERVTKNIYDMLHLCENIETINRALKMFFICQERRPLLNRGMVLGPDALAVPELTRNALYALAPLSASAVLCFRRRRTKWRYLVWNAS